MLKEESNSKIHRSYKIISENKHNQGDNIEEDLCSLLHTDDSLEIEDEIIQ